MSREVRKQVVSFGDAGQVTVIFDVEWMDLPDDVYAALNRFIRDLEAIGDPVEDDQCQPRQDGAP